MRKLSYRSAFVWLFEQFDLSAANAVMHWRLYRTWNESAWTAFANSSPSVNHAWFAPPATPPPAAVKSQRDHCPSLNQRYSLYWTYPANRGRSKYSSHCAAMEAVPPGTANAQVTTQLN